MDKWNDNEVEELCINEEELLTCDRHAESSKDYEYFEFV